MSYLCGMEADFKISEMVLLARRRLKSGGKMLSQSKFAMMIGCTTAHLNAVECGRHSCSIKLLRKMAEVMGMELEIKFKEKK